MVEGFLVLCACLFAGCFGALMSRSFLGWRRHKEAQRDLRHAAGITDQDGSLNILSAGIEGAVLGYALNLEQRLVFGSTESFATRFHVDGLRSAWFEQHVRRAGIDQALSLRGFNEARVRLMVAGMATGALIGALFSLELSLMLCVLGAVVGTLCVSRAVLREEELRAQALERELPEMLEVVSLGLRSGLTFDRSFQLYHSHFDTSFARACKQAQQRWNFGFATRDAALRDLASTYDSALFSRIIETIVRSMRFGTSFAENLDSAAVESRSIHKAHREELVAKAPVKMMVPTGALILPAMLLLVVGPILLELVEGF